MEELRKRIIEKNQKMLETKNNLKSAQPCFDKYKKYLLNMRQKKLEQQQEDFSQKQGVKAKQDICEAANLQLKLSLVKLANDMAAEQRRRRDLEK